MDKNWLNIEQDGEDVTLTRCSMEAQGKIVIPNNVTCINQAAFMFCKHVTHVVIPESVKKIGMGVFFRCDNLTHVEIPESLEHEIKNAQVFLGCGCRNINILYY